MQRSLSLASAESDRMHATEDSLPLSSRARRRRGALTQYSVFTNVQQTAATDDAMIANLRGQTGSEMGTAKTNQLFRERLAVLGDVVRSKPVYVK